MRRLLPAFALAAVLSIPAQAKTAHYGGYAQVVCGKTGCHDNPSNGWEACMPDFTRLCPGVKNGGGRMAKCLGPHQSEVTASCAPILSRWCSLGSC
jgi:hypothetical protein